MCLLIPLSLSNDFTLPNLFNTNVDGLKVLGPPLVGARGGGGILYICWAPFAFKKALFWYLFVNEMNTFNIMSIDKYGFFLLVNI
jgi:hypothetical protein